MKKVMIFGIFLLFLLINFSSAARLPTVGGDSDAWGTVLNEFLNTSLNDTGHLRDNSILSLQITNSTIVDADISDTTNLTLGQKITFAFGEIIDNIVDGLISITGNLNVTGDIISNGNNLTNAYFYSTNGTYYLATNPFGFYNSTDFNIANYYLLSNPFSFYNSTTIPAYATWANAVNGTLLSQATYDTNYSDFYPKMSNWNSNYSTFLTHITWANAVNGTLLSQATYNTNYSTLYLSSNPFSFYNSTTLPPSSSAQWTSNGNDVYNATSGVQVGIGTANSGYQLEIGDGTGSESISLNKSTADYASIVFARTATKDYLIQERADITQPNLIFRVNDTTNVMTLSAGGNVGIGTASPAHRLDVNGNIRTYGTNPVVIVNGTTGAFYQLAGGSLTSGSRNYEIRAYTGTDGINFLKYPDDWSGTGTSLMTILSSGNVGIGTTSPESLLNILKTEDNSATAMNVYTGGITIDNQQATAGAYSAIRLKAQANDYVYMKSVRNADNDVDLILGNWMSSIGDNKIMTLDSAGNVGIGTTSPPLSLSLNSTGNTGIRIETGGSDKYAQLQFYGTPIPTIDHTIAYIPIYANTSGGFVAVASMEFAKAKTGLSNDTRFSLSLNNGTSLNEVLRINGSSGNVGIGTTTPGTTAKLTISSVDDSASAIFVTNTAGTNRFALNGRSTGAWSMYDYAAGAWTEGITQKSGSVGIGTATPAYQLQLSTDSAGKPTTNTWTIVSDERIKKDVRDFTDGLNVIQGIRPVYYKYNGKYYSGIDTTKEHIGVISQEIEKVAPYTVSTRTEMLDGKEVNDFKDFNAHALTFVLINAIKEQQAQIDDLKLDNQKIKQSLCSLTRDLANMDYAQNRSHPELELCK